MIDVHCHLEQEDYSQDREEVIEKCKKELEAVISCCAHPEDFDLTMQMVDQHKGFIFATVSIHPIHIKEITESEKDNFLDLIKENKNRIVGIGECGLDFKIEESEWQQKQKELFVEFINLSKEINLPLIIHARQAFRETVEILENYNAKNVLMHFFSAKELLERVVNNGWYISVNTTLLTSKNIKKIVRDIPLELLMLETDSPWLGLENKRNDPTAVRIVADRVAEIKKLNFEEVDRITTQNAMKFFKLE